MCRVANQRPDLIRKHLVSGQDLVKIYFVLNLERLRDKLLVLGERAVELGEIDVHQVCNAYAAPGDFILVAGPNTSGSCADRLAVCTPFGDLFERAMKRKDDVRPIANPELRLYLNAQGL